MVRVWAILKALLLSKTAVTTYWASFEKNWATFYFSIWSHCSHTTLHIFVIKPYLREVRFT